VGVGVGVCVYIYIYIYIERERERERDLMDRGGEDGGRQESEGRLADVNTTLFPFIYFFLVSSALP
jgi:hypothetical protein